MGQSVLAACGVPAPEDLGVSLPVLADLVLQLVLYARQGLVLHAAELRGLVLYAEQEGVFVLDGRLAYAP